LIPLTLDASVVVKWFYRSVREPDLRQAESIQQAYAADKVVLFQPAHWRAEVAAVLARLSAGRARRDVTDLCLLDVETVDTPDVYLRATGLAANLSHHLFDTVYHAVALSVPGCTLVTADSRYFRKAQHLGRIMRLADWRAAPETS
jgi:predicted nucleic acid-binding protein